MDMFLIDRFVDEVYPLVQARFRFMNQRWWVIKDGFWTREMARYRLEADLCVLADASRLVGEDKVNLRFGVRKTHVMNQILARMSMKLHTSDGLPARMEHDLRLTGLTFEPLVHEAELGQAHGWEPGLPVADLPQEQVDQADTASRDDHTP